MAVVRGKQTFSVSSYSIPFVREADPQTLPKLE